MVPATAVFLIKTGTSERFTVTRHSNTPSSQQYILKLLVCLAAYWPAPVFAGTRNDRSSSPTLARYRLHRTVEKLRARRARGAVVCRMGAARLFRRRPAGKNRARPRALRARVSSAPSPPDPAQ